MAAKRVELDVEGPELHNSEADEDLGVEEEDTGSGGGPEIEPFDPAKIRIRTESQNIDALLKRMAEKEIDLSPDFQRHAGIWSVGAQSRLIESILIRIPLPAFYMDATNDDRWLVVDGLQRLTALRRFAIDKSLKLTGLEYLKDLEGRRYDKLDRRDQRRIHETQVTLFLIEQGTPPNVKFNIFKRINTGGLPLSNQEIRHALFQGDATRLLKRLAESEPFLRATDNSIRYKRMADRECVLRFLAFWRVQFTDYPNADPNGRSGDVGRKYGVSDFDAFLNATMEGLNRTTPAQRAALSRAFTRAMEAAWAVFGRDAFRKVNPINPRRLPINRALFEAWAVALARLPERDVTTIVARKDLVRERFAHLMQDREFDAATSFSTGDPKKVTLRFSAVEQLIRKALE